MNCLFKVIAVWGAFVEFSHGFTTRPHGVLSAKQSPNFMVSSQDADRICEAKNLITSLVGDKRCFSTESGAMAFRDICSADCIFEDCYEPEPFVGKEAVCDHVLSKATQMEGEGFVRVDRISDGTSACGYAWTWVNGLEEGLRGTTFVELNEAGEIQYIREIPEPLYKPGDLTLDLLKAVTKNAVPKPPPTYEPKTPQSANEVAKYLFCDVQGGDIDESMRLFSDNIIYRDFNYDEVLNGKVEVRKFIEDFSFPGIEFKPDRFDDGVLSTCFTWDVCLDGQTDSIKGISFYELDPETRLIRYVRDVPESAIKPPPLGRLARALRPGLGVFEGVPAASREGGM